MGYQLQPSLRLLPKVCPPEVRLAWRGKTRQSRAGPETSTTTPEPSTHNPEPTCSVVRPRRSFATSVWCVSASPSSQGRPACLMDVHLAAPAQGGQVRVCVQRQSYVQLLNFQSGDEHITCSTADHKNEATHCRSRKGCLKQTQPQLEKIQG
jgi:hypothetical protein